MQPVAAPTRPAPATASLPEPQQESAPGRPQWYGQRIGKEERSWLSRTGDVHLFAGNTFPTRFNDMRAAIGHARTMSQAEKGAIFVMRDPHAGPHTDGAKPRHSYWLTRSYNVEEVPGRGMYVDQSQFDGSERLTQLHPLARAIVDGDVVRRLHHH